MVPGKARQGLLPGRLTFLSWGREAGDGQISPLLSPAMFLTSFDLKNWSKWVQNGLMLGQNCQCSQGSATYHSSLK